MNDEEMEQIKKDFYDLKKRFVKMNGFEKEDAEKKGREYAEMFRQRMKEAIARSKMAKEKIQNMAEENPWALAGIGMLVGAGIGFTLGMSKKRYHC